MRISIVLMLYCIQETELVSVIMLQLSDRMSHELQAVRILDGITNPVAYSF